MPVEDVFGIKGRAPSPPAHRARHRQGRRRGRAGRRQATRKIVVTGVEMFKKLLDEGRAGDNVGLPHPGIEREEIERGQVLAKSGSVKPHTKFTGPGLRPDARRRAAATPPSTTATGPQFYLRTTDVTGAIGLPDGPR
jgi:elongation factor Tu